MPRESIALTPDELRAFAQGERMCVVATNDGDGGLWADAAACALYDGKLYFRLPESSRSCANIRSDSRVACMLERAPSYYEIKGAAIHGRAAHVAEPAALAVVAPLLDRAGDPVTPGAGGAVYAVPLDDVASFDFSKIKGRP